MPRRNALIVVGIAGVALLLGIVLLWNKGSSGSTTAFCNSLRNGENPLDVFDRYDPSNVDAARDQLQRGLDRMQELERAAPGEIDGDMKVLVEAARQLRAALDTTATSRPSTDLSDQFARVPDASANVVRFAADRCGVTLDSSSTDNSVTTSTP